MTLYIKFQKIIFSDILKTKEDSNMNKSFCTIKVLDLNGNWYDNAYIENDYDALLVAKFIKIRLDILCRYGKMTRILQPC